MKEAIAAAHSKDKRSYAGEVTEGRSTDKA